MINEIMNPTCIAHKSREFVNDAGFDPCATCWLLPGREFLGYDNQVDPLDAADDGQSRFDSNFLSNQCTMEIIDA